MTVETEGAVVVGVDVVRGSDAAIEVGAQEAARSGRRLVLIHVLSTPPAGFPFDADELTQRLERYAETAYAFFRFATTEAFQEAHRGEPAPLAGEMP